MLLIILININRSVSGPAQVVSRMLTEAMGDGKEDISSMISEGRLGHQEEKHHSRLRVKIKTIVA